MNRKFIPVLVVYFVLALLAWLWLGGTPRIAVLVLFAGLAAKTLVARAAKW